MQAVLALIMKIFVTQNRAFTIAGNSMTEVTIGSDSRNEYLPTISVTQFTAYQ